VGGGWMRLWWINVPKSRCRDLLCLNLKVWCGKWTWVTDVEISGIQYLTTLTLMMETEQVFGMWINWVLTWLITWEDISECDIYYGFCLQGMSKETALTEADINAAAEAWQNGAARRPKPKPQVSPVWVIHFHFPHLLFLFPNYFTFICVQALSLVPLRLCVN